MAQKWSVLVHKWSLDGAGWSWLLNLIFQVSCVWQILQFLRSFLLLLFLHICLVIVLSVAWMGVLLCGPRVPRGRICISLYSNQGYQGGEGDGGSFIRVGEVITMKWIKKCVFYKIIEVGNWPPLIWRVPNVLADIVKKIMTLTIIKCHWYWDSDNQLGMMR